MELIIGAPQDLDGGDITFTSGKGTTGGKDGSIVFLLPDGTELIKFDSSGEMHLLGESIPFEKVREWLKKLKDPEDCICHTDQLMSKGCSCNGA